MAAGQKSSRKRCRICEGRIGDDGKCTSCGAKVAATDTKLPGPAEPGTLGSYGKIKYHD